jgi:hypothetical protein
LQTKKLTAIQQALWIQHSFQTGQGCISNVKLDGVLRRTVSTIFLGGIGWRDIDQQTARYFDWAIVTFIQDESSPPSKAVGTL